MLLDPGDLARIIYIDHYGNAVTGLHPKKKATLRAGKRALPYARTFEEASGPFWHENSMGLAEIAVPQGGAAARMRLRVGSPVAWQRA